MKTKSKQKNVAEQVTSSHREQRLVLHSLGIYGSEEGEWKIGTYLGAGTICVNYTLHGKSFHRSDYGGILPRWLRIGLAIRSITKEANSLQNDQVEARRE